MNQEDFSCRASLLFIIYRLLMEAKLYLLGRKSVKVNHFLRPQYFVCTNPSSFIIITRNIVTLSALPRHGVEPRGYRLRRRLLGWRWVRPGWYGCSCSIQLDAPCYFYCLMCCRIYTICVSLSSTCRSFVPFQGIYLLQLISWYLSSEIYYHAVLNAIIMNDDRGI